MILGNTIKNLICLSTLTVLGYASMASANNNNAPTMATQTSIIQAEQLDENGELQKKRLTVGLGVEYAEQVAQEEFGQRGSSTDFSLSLSYKTSSLTTLTTSAAVSKDNTGTKDTLVSDTSVSLGIKGIELAEGLTTGHSVSAVVPTSERSQDVDRLNTSVNISNGFNYLTPYVTATYRLGLRKNFHEYNFNADGAANIEYTLSNTVALAIPVVGKWGVNLEGSYRISRTYGSFQRSAFGFNGDIIYSATDKFSVNVGTSNQGSALKANGVDSNIALYDEYKSVVKAGLSYVY